MNTERLHAIAKAVKTDLEETEAVSGLNAIQNALQNQVSQPNQAQHQESLANGLDELQRHLSAAPSNDFSPAWQDALQELDVWNLLGQRLLDRVMSIFERNQITPSVALEEVQELYSELEAIGGAVENLLNCFSTFGIAAEELLPGETELGFLIPREAIDNELEPFGHELVTIQKILGPFSEMATGSRPGYELRTVSSTDLSVFVDLAPQVAACLAVGVERIVTLYKRLLEIRKLRSEIKEQGVSEEALEGIDAHAQSHMDDGIEPLIEELMERFGDGIDTNRKNELRTELRLALNEIANRIDRGYNVEIRMEPPETEGDESEGGADAEDLKGYLDMIRQAAETLEFIRSEGEPFLHLPSGLEEGEEDGEGGN